MIPAAVARIRAERAGAAGTARAAAFAAGTLPAPPVTYEGGGDSRDERKQKEPDDKCTHENPSLSEA